MAIVTGQVATATSAAVPVCTIPPGACTVVLTNANSTAANTVWIGTATGVTAANGSPVPASGSVTIHGYPGSAGATIYAIAGASTPVIGYVISTPK